MFTWVLDILPRDVGASFLEETGRLEKGVLCVKDLQKDLMQSRRAL